VVKRRVEVELTAKDAGVSKTFNELIDGLDEVSKAAKRLKLAETVSSPVALAQTSLDELTQSLKRGEITIGQYEDAARRIQRAFGMVTPETERAAKEMEELHRAFVKGEISAEDYEKELRDLGRTLDGVEKQGSLLKGALQGAMMGVGSAAMDMARQLPRATIELLKLGADANRQATALKNLALDVGTSSEEIIASIQEASGYTIDRMTAMAAANKALVMDVATTPEQFERLTKVAVALGRAMGVDAVQSIDDFVTAGARQSKMIADNLGLTVGVEQANIKYARALGKTVEELTDAERKQAFLNEMLVQGEAKLGALGTSTDDLASGFESLGAVLKDIRTDIAMTAAESVAASQSINKFALSLREAAEAQRTQAQEHRAARAEVADLEAYMTDAEKAELRAARSMEERSDALAQARIRQEAHNRALANAGPYLSDIVETTQRSTDAQEDQNEITRDSIRAFASYEDTVERAFRGEERAIQESTATYGREMAKRREELERAAVEAQAATQAMTLSLSMSWTQHFEDVAEKEASFVDKREELEAQHQEKLAEIRKKGQATAIRIDVDAERAKLQKLQERLQLALLDEQAFTDKTKEATRLRKEYAIRDLQEQVAAQSKLLDDYHAGRLVAAGQNVDALITEEQRRHDAAIAGLDEEISKQQQLQKEQQAQMIMQAFDMWGANKDIASEKMVEMRTAIAEEYGLVDEGTTALITDMMSEWESWASGVGASTEETVGYIHDVMTATGDLQTDLLELTAEDWVIKVRVEQEMAPHIGIDGGGAETAGIQMQRGGAALVGPGFGGPMNFRAGEGGRAEVVRVTPMVDSHDTYNVSGADAVAIMAETRRRERRAELGRLM